MPAKFAPPPKQPAKKKRKRKTRECARCGTNLHVDNSGKYCSEECKAFAREEQKQKRAEEKIKNAARDEEKKRQQQEEAKKAIEEANVAQLKQSRQNAVKRLAALFDDDEEAAKKLEKRLTKQHKNDNQAYKVHVQNIVSNLKQNRALLDKVLGGEVTLKKLCLMSVEDMAPAEIAQQRRQFQEEFEQTRVLNQKPVLGIINMKQPLATENEDLGYKDPDLNCDPDAIDLDVSGGMHATNSTKMIETKEEDKKEEEEIKIDVDVDVDVPMTNADSNADAKETLTETQTPSNNDPPTKMDVDEDVQLHISEDSDDAVGEHIDGIPSSPILGDSASPPPAKKRRLSPSSSSSSPSKRREKRTLESSSTPSSSSSPSKNFRIPLKGEPEQPSSPPHAPSVIPSFPTPSLADEAPEPPPSFESTPPPRKKKKRSYSDMEKSDQRSSRHSDHHSSSRDRTRWSGTFMVSKTKQTGFRIDIRRVAGANTNYPKVIPRKLSVCGRVKLAAINASLQEFAKGAHRKSQKMTSMFKVRRHPPSDPTADEKHNGGSQEAYNEMINNFRNEGKGAVVDLKKERKIKMYFLPPNLDGLDTALVAENWDSDPPSDCLWGFLIHYRSQS